MNKPNLFMPLNCIWLLLFCLSSMIYLAAFRLQNNPFRISSKMIISSAEKPLSIKWATLRPAKISFQACLVVAMCTWRLNFNRLRPFNWHEQTRQNANCFPCKSFFHFCCEKHEVLGASRTFARLASQRRALGHTSAGWTR